MAEVASSKWIVTCTHHYWDPVTSKWLKRPCTLQSLRNHDEAQSTAKNLRNNANITDVEVRPLG